MKRLTILALSLFALGLAAPVQAAELPPPFFTQFPEAPATPGEGAGELNQPRGIVANPANHHVYVTESNFAEGNGRVSEFTAWGEFVRAFGWGVRDGSPELQSCTAATGCQKGLTGSGAGQFGSSVFEGLTYGGPTGIAVDSSGDIYVMDLGNRRVQKFDPEGNFILTFGGGVNQDTSLPFGDT